jgi:hypothetical protein
MKKSRILSVLAILIFTATIAAAVHNQGAGDITLDGGGKGEIKFPHHLHQNAITDCNACHYLFPQKPEAIKAFKQEQKLKRMQVMNKLCIKCHKEKKNAGEKTGPVKCSQCHIK